MNTHVHGACALHRHEHVPCMHIKTHQSRCVIYAFTSMCVAYHACAYTCECVHNAICHNACMHTRTSCASSIHVYISHRWPTSMCVCHICMHRCIVPTCMLHEHTRASHIHMSLHKHRCVCPHCRMRCCLGRNS